MNYKDVLLLAVTWGFTFSFLWAGQMLPWLAFGAGLTMFVGFGYNFLNGTWAANKDRR
jgi:hypothetical protein